MLHFADYLIVRYKYFLPSVAAVLLAFSLPTICQVPSPTATPAAAAKDAAAALPAVSRDIKRWFDIDTLVLAARYRFVENAGEVIGANQFQYQITGRFRFKFDRAGRYSIAAGTLTGSNFVAGWNSTGWGTGKASNNFNVRQLYFDARPIKSLEMQIGGISINNGENTEVIGYDSDNYIVGERVQIRHPKKLYFDEISLTNGYLGDLLHPSVFVRLKRLDQSNYHQFLVRKQVNKIVGFSADYTFQAGADTLRQAVKFNIPGSRFLDLVLFENYEQLDPNPGYGFDLYGQKKLGGRFTLGGGFARIDRVMLNGDRYPRGDRLYLNAVLRLSREFSLTTVLIQGVGSNLPVVARTRLDVILSYNVLETLHRTRIF